VLLLATAVIGMPPALGGEISGLPPHLAPTQRPDYQFYLGNDTARLGQHWRMRLSSSPGPSITIGGSRRLTIRNLAPVPR